MRTDIVDSNPDQYDAAFPGLRLGVHQIDEPDRLPRRVSHQLIAGRAGDGKIVAIVVFCRRAGKRAKSFVEIRTILTRSPDPPFAEVDLVASQPGQHFRPLPSRRAPGSASRVWRA